MRLLFLFFISSLAIAGEISGVVVDGTRDSQNGQADLVNLISLDRGMIVLGSSPNVTGAFTIAFDDAEYDESSYQREMVDQINSDHYSLNINSKQIDDAFPDAIYHTERPVFRTAAVPLYLLSQKVKENDIKVVLTGEGADEILWGYDSFKEVKMLEFWSKFPDSSIRPQLIKKLYPHLNHYSDGRQYGMMKMFYEGFLGDFDNKLASTNIRIHNNKIIKNYFNRDHNLSYEKDSMIKEMDSISGV